MQVKGNFKYSSYVKMHEIILQALFVVKKVSFNFLIIQDIKSQFIDWKLRFYDFGKEEMKFQAHFTESKGYLSTFW